MTRSEQGFTLAELLIVVSILGLIGFALTNAVISGLRTTNNIADRVSGTSAVETLNSYFFGDVQNADQVSSGAMSPSDPNCGSVPGTLLVHLSWTDTDTSPIGQSTTTDVFYTLETLPPQAGGGQDLLRVRCIGNSRQTETIMGHFSSDPSSNDPSPTPPVTVVCGVVLACPPPDDPSAVILRVQSDPTAPTTNLTAVRRTPVTTTTVAP
jgi:prepilin-type N-terminal cleavage/methylation domain-containing protein